MKRNQIITTVIVVLVVAAAAFYGGMQYQKNMRGTGSGQNRQFTTFNRNGMGGMSTNNRPVAGEITSSDDKSITVKTQDGSSKIVLVSDSTAVTEATSAGKQALQNGKNVVVFGNQNSDGSVTAMNIQIGGNFAMRTQRQ